MKNLLLTLLHVTLANWALTEQKTRPNIIFIFIDDLGWGDVGCYGNDFIGPTSNNGLPRDEMSVTAFYTVGAA